MDLSLCVSLGLSLSRLVRTQLGSSKPINYYDAKDAEPNYRANKREENGFNKRDASTK